MKLKFIGLVTSLALLGAIPSQANVIDLGNNTYDPNTGLYWLDVNLSANRSYNDVSLQFGVGGNFPGYRYASGSEVNTLLLDAGILTVPCLACSGDSQGALYDSLITMLGATYDQPDIRYTSGFHVRYAIPGIGIRHSAARFWSRTGSFFYARRYYTPEPAEAFIQLRIFSGDHHSASCCSPTFRHRSRCVGAARLAQEAEERCYRSLKINF